MGTNGLAPRDALRGLRIGISVSESDDLGRLGLSVSHAEQAVGEIARAVLVAGGSLVYGGRVKPSGFTQYLVHEVRRYGGGPVPALTLCLAAPEHQRLSCDELADVDRMLGAQGRLVRLDQQGREIQRRPEIGPRDTEPLTGADAAHAYSALRRHMATITDARVLIGGKLSGFAGEAPGVLEEAIVAVKARQPVYVSAGFGGAAAMVAATLGLDDLRWAPENFPTRPDDERIDRAARVLAAAAVSSGWTAAYCGLGEQGVRQLAASHRASEIASLVVRGLARVAQ